MRQNLNNEVRPDVLAKRQLKKHGWRWGYFIRWHLKHGWLISVPYLFAAGYFYMDGEKLVCHVTYARGDLTALFRFGLNNWVDIVEYHSKFSRRLIRCDFEKLLRRVSLWEANTGAEEWVRR